MGKWSNLLKDIRRFDWFYIDSKPKDDVFRLSPREGKHARVLRKKSGDVVVITDGRGNLCLAEILKCDKYEFLLKAERWKYIENEDKRKIDLYLAILKGNKDRFVVQKAAELGMNSINFFYSTRSIPRIKNTSKRLERFKWIVIDAMKQSKYPYMPDINLYEGIEEVIAKVLSEDDTLKFLFWERETRKLRRLGKDDLHVVGVIGGEGGFEPFEVNRFVDAGFTSVSLGARILRAETAVISAMVLLKWRI